MLKWSLYFLINAIVAVAFGFTGIAGGAALTAQTLFLIFLVLSLWSLILGLTIFKSVRS